MTKRYLPLDVLRGITIALMIIVNTPGSWAHVYPPFLHAEWNGATLTDLVFPFFLFIVGAAIYFSFRKFDYELNSATAKKIIRRTLLIFLIGLALNAFPFIGRDYEKLRIMGVLQRIGLAYGLGAFAILILKDAKQLFIFSVAVLLGYWAVMYWGAPEAPYGLETNFGRQIDLRVLGANHMWHGKEIAFDPEGLLSTFPSMVTVIAGFLSIRLILEKDFDWMKTLGFGALLLFIGWVWGLAFPINKSLWTSSYVVFTAGWAVIALGVIQALYENNIFRMIVQPFIILGSNPLFIFVLSIVVVKTYFRIHLMSSDGEIRNLYGYLYHDVMLPAFGAMNGSLMFALAHLTVFYLVAWVMYRKGWFVKI